jgi:uncharacterized protein involved in exopolysaccharide biosynthesis
MQPQELVIAVAQAWRRIVGTGSILAVLVVGLNFFSARKYTSAASFVPNAGGGLSQFAGLASQFGVALPGDGGGLSAEFYSDFVKSGVVLKWVISPDTAWGTTPIAVDPVVAEGLDVTDDDAALRQWRTVNRVRKAVTATADPISRLVRVQVTTTDAALSARLADRLLIAVERFNASSRQRQALLDAEFSEERGTAPGPARRRSRSSMKGSPAMSASRARSTARCCRPPNSHEWSRSARRR